jgi:hypothetical protein
MKRATPFVLFGTVLLGVACGGGGAAADDCDKIADAYAKSWQRCMRGTYDDAKKLWSDALMCGKASSSKSAQVDSCVSALNALDCSSVKSGTRPADCDGAIAE